MKFKISNDPQEIEKVIRQSMSDDECIIWQSTPTQRTVYKIDQINVDRVRKIIRFLINYNHQEELDPALTVYVKLSFRSTIFKGDYLGVNGKYIFVSIPDEIQFQELREFPRFSFDPTEDKSVTFSIKSELISNSAFNLKVKLIDISQTGLGVILSHSNQELVNNNQFNLSALGKIDIETPIPSEFIYTNNFSYKDDGKKIKCLKMGAKLGYHIEQSFLDAFMRSVEGFDHSKIGFLGHDFEFQNSLHYQMENMYKHLKNKNDIFAAINQTAEIATTLKEGEYFPKHIRLLAKISCGFAKLFDLDNKKVMQQLIYASFVHDIAFYANPKLALIKDLKHLEDAKKELTSDEIDLFIHSPKHAFDYAFYDKFAPKGVENILLQAKELPNGEGFPNRLKADKIHPLSAIFIVAHDLTDYVLERRTWNFYDYVTQYNKNFKGGIFDEIFIKLEQSRKVA